MKKITAMLLAGAMIFTLAACGSKEEPAAPAPAPSAPAASAPAAAPSDDPYADLDEVVLTGGDNSGVGAACQLFGELVVE